VVVRGKGPPDTPFVYVFRYEEGSWQQQTEIAAPGSASVHIRERDLIIGGDDPRIYHYNGTEWVITAELRDLLPMGAATFGPNVHLSENLALVGTPSYRSEAAGPIHGAVFVFKRTDESWAYLGTLVPDDAGDAGTAGALGLSLASNGDQVLAGASDSVYVFRVCSDCSALTDMQVFQSCFCTAYERGGACGRYDFTGDGVVGADDFAILAPAMTSP
jgi:hypothetical protein